MAGPASLTLMLALLLTSTSSSLSPGMTIVGMQLLCDRPDPPPAQHQLDERAEGLLTGELVFLSRRRNKIFGYFNHPKERPGDWRAEDLIRHIPKLVLLLRSSHFCDINLWLLGPFLYWLT